MLRHIPIHINLVLISLFARIFKEISTIKLFLIKAVRFDVHSTTFDMRKDVEYEILYKRDIERERGGGGRGGDVYCSRVEFLI